MPTDVRIIHGRDCPRAAPDGTLDRAASERLLAGLAAASRDLAKFDVILDCRRAETTMTIADLWYLAQYLARLREFHRRKITVLPPAADFDRADFFALATKNRSMGVRAFASFEEAIDWLAEGRTAPTH